MADNYQLRTYGDNTQSPDVMRIIEILTAHEDSIMMKLGKGQATAVVHETMVDTLLTPASLAVTEGGDFSNTALTTPTRKVNIVENIVKKFEVTKTQKLVNHFHGQDEVARQTEKALMDWHNAAEFDLVRSTLVSGVSGTAAKMSGIIEAISTSTNVTAHNSGTVWSATILEGMMVLNWDNSNGDVATDLYMGSYLKSITDGFTNKTNVSNVGVDVKSVIKSVSVYETSLGTLVTHAHRFVQQSSDSTARVLAIRPEKLRTAWLEMPYVKMDLAVNGDYEPRAVIGKFTLEVKNQNSNWFTYGFKKS